MKSQIADSFQVIKFCFIILRAEKQLLIFPLISGIIISVFSLFAFIATLFTISSSTESPLFYDIVKYIFVFFCYFLTSFVVTFSNAAFVSIVYDKLTGGEGRFWSGLRVAKKHSKQILIWSFLSATPGVLSRLSRDKLGIVGGVISTAYDLTWSLATFFVVPIILTGNFSVKHSIQESATLFHKTWKENTIGQLSSGLILLVFALPPLLYLAFLAKTENVAWIVRLFPIAVLYFSTLIAISYAINRIYMVVLFVYAKTGEVKADNYQQLVHLAFRAKNNSKISSQADKIH